MLDSEDIAEGEPIQPPRLVHEPVIIQKPATRGNLPATLMKSPYVLAYFDGGAAKQCGVGGFIVWDASGVVRTAQGLYFGSAHSTNNGSEAAALVTLMRWLATNAAGLGVGSTVHWVLIKGDSKLIIDFCNRLARPGE